LADQIYRRVDWRWAQNRAAPVTHGWKPEQGFLKNRWEGYNEALLLYILGLGSPNAPLPPESWRAWQRPQFTYDGYTYVHTVPPLFLHQYSHAWFDFRGVRDHHADYFENSVIATRAHRQFCLDLQKEFPGYSEDLWGITASDSVKGYVVWGGPPEIGPIDGTVVPSAAGGSLPFLPQATLRVLKNIRNRHGSEVWSRYGPVNAFNPLKKWYDTDVIAIDTGIILLMAENLRTGFVWNTFMKNPEAQSAMEKVGFHSA